MIASFWHTFVVIVQEPFLHTDLVWGIVPLYFGWLLNELTSSKASHRTALQTGFTFVWAAAQWLWHYHREHPGTGTHFSLDALRAVNTFVTLLVLVIGVVALFSGLLKKFPKHGKFLGHTRFAAYFMITMFPMQAGSLSWTWERLAAILIFAVPTWLVVHVGLMPVRK